MRLSAMSMIGTTISNSMQIPCKTMNVAIIGGGITGACAASVLASANTGGGIGDCNLGEVPKSIIEPITKTNRCWRSENDNGEGRMQINIDLFDQGRNGVGGRSSHRRRKVDGKEMRWDHGCQVCLWCAALQRWLHNLQLYEWQAILCFLELIDINYFAYF